MIDPVAIFGLVAVAWIIGFEIGRAHMSEEWKRCLVKRNLALYDPITGKWRWREPSDAPAHQERNEP